MSPQRRQNAATRSLACSAKYFKKMCFAKSLKRTSYERLLRYVRPNPSILRACRVAPAGDSAYPPECFEEAPRQRACRAGAPRPPPRLHMICAAQESASLARNVQRRTIGSTGIPCAPRSEGSVATGVRSLCGNARPVPSTHPLNLIRIKGRAYPGSRTRAALSRPRAPETRAEV